jgi:hypothetical protein
MPRHCLPLLAVLAAALSGTALSAQVMTDGAPAPRVTQRVHPAAIAGMARRYLVAAACSISGSATNCATTVEITNLTGQACDVGVEFYKGISQVAPTCSAVHNDLPTNRQATICSRVAAPSSCNSTCSPALTGESGYAVVYSSCPLIAVQATIYTLAANDAQITSAHSVNLIRYRVPPDARANQGD